MLGKSHVKFPVKVSLGTPVHYFLVSYFHNYEELCIDFEMEQ